MAHPIPKTLTEARKIGHEIFGKEKTDALATAGVHFAGPDCSTLNPGDKCAEMDCNGGYRIVLYCDGTKGCTVAVKIPC